MSGRGDPVESACVDIPARFARALGLETSPWGDHTGVLLAKSEPPAEELYQVACAREGSESCGLVGGNGRGETGLEEIWGKTERRLDEKDEHGLAAEWAPRT